MSNLENLLSKIKSLPALKQRRVSAILGAVVADVATRPLLWIYNQRTLEKILGNSTTPEFWPESQSPYHTIPLGLPSCYGDMALVTLNSLSEQNGKVDFPHICESFKKHFGKGTAYHDAIKLRDGKYPVQGPWVHKAVILFLDKYEKQKEGPYGDPKVVEYDGFCAALPIIATHAGKPELWDICYPVTSMLNNNEAISKMFHTSAIMLEGFIMGIDDPIGHAKESIKSIYPDVYEIITEVEESTSLPFVSAIAQFGKACYLPGSFQGTILTMLRTTSYVDAVRLNITGGGCNCSRGAVAGACYAAKYGIDSIPVDWLKKVKDIEQITETAINVVSL